MMMTTRRLITTPIADRDPEGIRAELAAAHVSDNAIRQFLKLRDYAAEHDGMGLGKLADKIRLTPGVLSECFNGKYPGNYDNVAKLIERFFRREANRQKYGQLQSFVDLQLTEYLWSVFEQISIVKRIQPIEGPEQCGKSRAAVEYAARNPDNTVYVDISGGSTNGLTDFIRKLAEACGIASNIKLCEMKLRIRTYLQGVDLLLIDEHHLAWKWNAAAIQAYLDYLRTDLFNNGRTGIVLIQTNDDFYGQLKRIRRTGHNVGQLVGRMRSEPINLGSDMIVLDDVKALVSRYYPEGKEPGEKTLRRLYDMAVQPRMGHYGLLLDVMNRAWIRANARKEPLSDKIVESLADATAAAVAKSKELYS